MLNRFLPLAAPIRIRVSLPAHTVRGGDTAGAGNLTSRGLHLKALRIHARWAFMAIAPSSRSRSS